MVVMFLLAALGASIPQADINRICESAKVDSLPEDRVTAMRGCVGDETSARDQLRRNGVTTRRPTRTIAPRRPECNSATSNC
jgi:hypothetical protein